MSTKRLRFSAGASVAKATPLRVIVTCSPVSIHFATSAQVAYSCRFHRDTSVSHENLNVNHIPASGRNFEDRIPNSELAAGNPSRANLRAHRGLRAMILLDFESCFNQTRQDGLI
jgi:hypothetical protein